MRVMIQSFGHKHGPVPEGADLVLDARVLPNPFYETKLRSLSGKDTAVAMWIMGKSETSEFISSAYQMIIEGVGSASNRNDSSYFVAIGCTGGHHRSVFMAERLGGRATLDKQMYKHSVTVHHRDL